MFTWISENIGAICICTVLLVVVIAIIHSMIKSRKKGKGSCSGNCGCCPMGGHCHDD